ncbi:MAG: triose-phosphate isomerase [Bacteroidia bacterium]
MNTRKNIAAGNWKMNLGPKAAAELAGQLADGFVADSNTEMILAVPFVDLLSVANAIAANPGIALAAQNLHQADSGAFTGEISAPMLVECGCKYVLVGHSERREYFAESNALLLSKVRQALKHGLRPIYCFGETLAQREAEQTFEVVREQLTDGVFALEEGEFAQVVLAYEPVWAIGTGKTATPEQAQEVHAYVRKLLTERYGEARAQATSILYGGSVNAANAATLFACADIDGGLVGGASLKAADFLTIARNF